MEILAPVFVIGTFVVILGGVLGLSIVYMRYQKSAWQRAAQELGLALAPHPHYRGALFKPYYTEWMVGERAGLPVRVGVRIVVSGSGKSRSRTFYTWAEVQYGRPLGLGLTAIAQGLLGRMFGAVVGEHDLQLGDATLDQAYTIHAVEPEVARRLLLVPYVREALGWHRDAPFRPQIHDDQLRVETRGKVLDAVSLGRALDGAVDLARRILAARAEVGPSSAEHVLATAWQQVATARGLALDLAAGRMSGRVEGMHVEAATLVQKGARVTQLVVRFDRPLGVGLRLTRQGALSGVGKLLGMQDIEVGDPVFDQRFVVKGAPVEAVRAMLTPEVRARLVELQAQAGELSVADDALVAEVAWLISDPAGLDAGLTAVARAGAALAGVTGAAAGPFRT